MKKLLFIGTLALIFSLYKLSFAEEKSLELESINEETKQENKKPEPKDQKTKEIDLEKIVVTPFKIATPLSEVTKGVSLTTPEEVQQSGSNYLPEIIQEKTGIAVTEQIDNPKGIKLDMRGFGDSSASNVLVLIDGRRTNQIDLSGVDWGQINVDTIDRIEVVRGPSTVLYGDNSSGGLINIITKKGESEKPKIQASTSLGSYDFQKTYTNISAGTKNYSYFLNYSHQQTDGYRINSFYWDNNIFGKTTLHPSENLDLELSAGYHRDRYGMPGALYPADIERLGRDGTTHPDDRGFTSDYYITAVPQSSFYIGDHEVILSLFNSYRERRTKSLAVYYPPYASEYETVHHISSQEIRPKLEINSTVIETDNKFVAGLDYFHAKDDILSGNRVANLQDEADIYKDTYGLYVYDLAETWGKFLVNAGGRLELADYIFDQKGMIANYDTKSPKQEAAEFGMGYEYAKESQVYINYARSYRLPTTEEYYSNKYLAWNGFTYVEAGGLNASLKPQQAHNYELGVRHNAMDFVKLNADIFLMDTKNEIYYDAISFTNTNYRPQTRRFGLELESKFNLLDERLCPFLTLTIQKPFFKGGAYAGHDVPFVPRYLATTGTTVSPIKNLKWTASCNYTGSRYAINDLNNIFPKLKSYITFDTIVNYTLGNTEFWFSVKNICDKKYSGYGVIGAGPAFYPSPERNFQAGVTVTF